MSNSLKSCALLPAPECSNGIIHANVLLSEPFTFIRAAGSGLSLTQSNEFLSAGFEAPGLEMFRGGGWNLTGTPKPH